MGPPVSSHVGPSIAHCDSGAPGGKQGDEVIDNKDSKKGGRPGLIRTGGQVSPLSHASLVFCSATIRIA